VINASDLSKDTRLPSDAVSKSREKSRIEAAMVARSADTYADFLLPHLQPEAQRPPVRNASMTSANGCGVLRVSPSRTLVVTCAGCFRGRV